MQLDPFVGIAILLAAALVGGMIAHRLRQPVILGYLVVGVVVGPHALGLVSDLALIETVATIGVALLMFTLGLEVSFSQLKQVGRVGLWGGIAQILATFAIGLLVGVTLFRWPLSEAILFGLIISLSSTAVCLKILMDRGEVDSVHGRIMIAILILQDVSVVVVMVVIPFMNGDVQNLPLALAITVGKTVLSIAAAIISGLWLLPWLMGKIGGVRSRELFLLTVLVLCLGAAVSTRIFGLSVIFGSFIVGLVLRETRFVHQALAEVTPLRDIFATLFFVSLGMLLSPTVIFERWASVLVLVVVIILIKVLVVFGVVRAFGYSSRIALLAGAGLFQIGEFGFILAQGGVSAGFVSGDFYDLIIASAIITMLLTPLSISLASRLYTRFASMLVGVPVSATPAMPELTGAPSRVVIAGYGRIGQSVAQGLQDAGIPYIIMDIDPERIAEARASGRPYIYGDASNARVLSLVDLSKVGVLVIAFPDPLATVATAKAALGINPRLHIVARAHRGREAEQLKSLGVTELVSPEYEASFRFLKSIFAVFDLQKSERQHILDKIRQDNKIPAFSTEDEE